MNRTPILFFPGPQPWTKPPSKRGSVPSRHHIQQWGHQYPARPQEAATGTRPGERQHPRTKKPFFVEPFVRRSPRNEDRGPFSSRSRLRVSTLHQQDSGFIFCKRPHWSATKSHAIGVPRTMSLDALPPKTSGRCFGLRPCPGRIERTLSSVNGSPIFTSLTTNRDRRNSLKFSSAAVGPYERGRGRVRLPVFRKSFEKTRRVPSKTCCPAPAPSWTV